MSVQVSCTDIQVSDTDAGVETLYCSHWHQLCSITPSVIWIGRMWRIRVNTIWPTRSPAHITPYVIWIGRMWRIRVNTIWPTRSPAHITPYVIWIAGVWHSGHGDFVPRSHELFRGRRLDCSYGLRSIHTKRLRHHHHSFDLFDGHCDKQNLLHTFLSVNVIFVMVTVRESLGVNEPLRSDHTWRFLARFIKTAHYFYMMGYNPFCPFFSPSPLTQTMLKKNGPF